MNITPREFGCRTTQSAQFHEDCVKLRERVNDRLGAGFLSVDVSEFDPGVIEAIRREFQAIRWRIKCVSQCDGTKPVKQMQFRFPRRFGL